MGFNEKSPEIIACVKLQEATKPKKLSQSVALVESRWWKLNRGS